jgi:hypothetical protein
MDEPKLFTADLPRRFCMKKAACAAFPSFDVGYA